MRAGQVTIHITKIAAAKRQLDAAIRMFFAGEDELAVHTIAAAAFRVLRDLHKKRGKSYSGKFARPVQPANILPRPSLTPAALIRYRVARDIHNGKERRHRAKIQ